MAKWVCEDCGKEEESYGKVTYRRCASCDLDNLFLIAKRLGSSSLSSDGLGSAKLMEENMNDIYECAACGITGELADLHHEEIDGTLTCRECNGDGELCLQAELEEFEATVKESMKPKNYFEKELKDQEEF